LKLLTLDNPKREKEKEGHKKKGKRPVIERRGEKKRKL